MRLLSASLVLALAALAPGAHAAQWDVDPSHGRVTFGVRHLMISDVEGRFKKFSGAVSFDEKDLTKSSVDVELDPASVDTGEPKRDEHLKSPEFFDTAKFPKMTFKSTKVEKKGKQLLVTGDLTLHGITKPVTLTVDGTGAEVKDPFGGTRTAFKATGKLNREDFGLKWNKALEAGGVVVGTEIAIGIEVELVKKVDAGAKKADTPPAAAPAPAAKH